MERKNVLDIHRFALEDAKTKAEAFLPAVEAGVNLKEKPPSLPKAGSIFSDPLLPFSQKSCNGQLEHDESHARGLVVTT